MKHTLYNPPSVTVDTVIFTIEDGELKVLLIKRSDPPFKGAWALPGGFLLRNEPSERGALRILKEKAGVKNVYIEQLYTFDGVGRDPRGHVLTVAYFALALREKISFEGNGELQTPAFYPVKKLPALAFDHKNIISYAIKRLQAKLEYTNVVFSLLPKYFTLNQLQKAYEIILDKKIDKRNFRKKFLSLGLMRSTKRMLSGTPQRPARLYQFTTTKPTELKKFF